MVFQIKPKEAQLELRILRQAMGEAYPISRFSRFERFDGDTPVRSESSDFSPAFLSALLAEIAVFCRNFDRTRRNKKVIAVSGGLRGRPVFQRIITDQARGRLDRFYCEVLDDFELRGYASVIYATAVAVARDLSAWNSTSDDAQDMTGEFRAIHSQLGALATERFTFTLLSRLCRPTFPFGFRHMLYKCRQYWTSSGKYAPAGIGTTAGFHGLVVFIDRVFQDYVGATWKASSRGYAPIVAKFPYLVREGSTTLREEHIRPDYIFRRLNGRHRMVVDAKYKTEISESDLYQILGYLSYRFSDAVVAEQRTGVLVYPGPDWRIQRIEEFSNPVFLIRMPVTPRLEREEIAQFLAAENVESMRVQD